MPDVDGVHAGGGVLHRRLGLLPTEEVVEHGNCGEGGSEKRFKFRPVATQSVINAVPLKYPELNK